MADLLTNFFHISIFALANLAFAYAIFIRLKLISKAQSAGKLAPWRLRIRSFLLNVLFQYKLFKKPFRGLIHAFIFYGFLVYALHTTSQMIAGNAWYIFKSWGLDPYTFQLADYIWLGYSLDLPLATLTLFGFLLLIAFTVMLMYSTQPKKVKNKVWKPVLEWFFLGLLLLETLGIFVLIFASGKVFYEGVVQYFSLFVLFGLSSFAYRRWVMRARGLDVPSSQSAIVLLLISTLMLSTLFGMASQSILDGHKANWISQIFLFLMSFHKDTEPSIALAVRDFSWWVHISTVYTFMVYVPLSKHSHLIFAPINFFLLKDRPLGQMNQMELEEEDALWGASNVAELQWTSLLDGLSCIECGRCTLACPANSTGKILDPKKIMVDIKHSMLENKNSLLAKNGQSDTSYTPFDW